MDKARKTTDKMLKNLERRVSEIYSADLSLRRIKKKYEAYMKKVKKATIQKYREYMACADNDEKEVKKQAYKQAVQKYTLESSEYRSIVKEFTQVMAGVNQKALELINMEMDKIYMLNYNQVAVDCKQVGIEVEDGSI